MSTSPPFQPRPVPNRRPDCGSEIHAYRCGRRQARGARLPAACDVVLWVQTFVLSTLGRPSAELICDDDRTFQPHDARLTTPRRRVGLFPPATIIRQRIPDFQPDFGACAARLTGNIFV